MGTNIPYDPPSVEIFQETIEIYNAYCDDPKHYKNKHDIDFFHKFIMSNVEKQLEVFDRFFKKAEKELSTEEREFRKRELIRILCTEETEREHE